mmetsp:Transcript_1617/g.3551  ORF Transcript_1617/g.3551 Transcript_1617/m.3551 type:complete len:104 (-) Transcript_1617:21-332(-)|eukprot:CAMPEP_0182464968 /NCGR_PEP_ID=MMETSP1319-20130603/8930_1 /TAXON_ID=172717 /ORGANISM="Bolidomonas pacifica, Strain RCC208" /LENGTH=103 /DNA_ID=CAMNT_0024664645 /DNA_START=363 /DNA_END=674 /DNA_ORIENTATION=-
MSSISSVESTLSRIVSHSGVRGVLILTLSGSCVRSSLPPDLTAQYSALVSELAAKAASVTRTLDATDEMTFLRVRSRQHEIMVAPDKEFLLVVIQDPEQGKEM